MEKLACDINFFFVLFNSLVIEVRSTKSGWFGKLLKSILLTCTSAGG